MATTLKRLTYDDLERIPQEHPGDRHEIIDGELVVTPSPIPWHQMVVTNLTYRLEQRIAANDLGVLLPAPTDIRLAPGMVLIPDLSFVARDRVHVIGPKAIDAPPDLVVEILSPGTRRRDLTTKREIYARFGVQEYWIVDHDARTVTVFALAGNRLEPVPPAEDERIPTRVLLGLAVKVQDVFRGLPG